jgi:hypothetical protein
MPLHCHPSKICLCCCCVALLDNSNYNDKQTKQLKNKGRGGFKEEVG